MDQEANAPTISNNDDATTITNNDATTATTIENHNIIIETNNDTLNTNNDKKPIENVLIKKKPTNIFKVALYLMRRRSNGKKKSTHVDVASKGLWKRLVSSMRPLHQQLPSSQSPPTISLPPPKEDFSFSGMNSPSSPSTSSTPSRYASAANLQELDKSQSPSPSPSPYASALNLQELDKSEGDKNEGSKNAAEIVIAYEDNERRSTFEIVVDDSDEEEDEDACFDGEGDEFIDARAEEFIASFYEQMRIQHLMDAQRYDKNR